MIAFVAGEIIAKGPSYLILRAGDLGYKINLGTFPKGEVGGSAEFFCYHHIKEDLNELYGFSTFDDLIFYEMLLSVNGVGPKVAQTIVGNLGKEKTIQAIESNDVNIFKSVPGIGTKVAAKIIVELKNKVSDSSLDLKAMESDETVDALLSLGLKKSEILPALKEIPAELVDIQDRIKFVLKHVSK